MTTQEIKKIIADDFFSRNEVRQLYGITPQDIANGATFDNTFSPASVENLLFYSTAQAASIVLQMFEQHKKEVDWTVANERYGTAKWYVQMAKQFRYGQPLIPDTDQYDNAGLTEQQIKNMQIVTFAAMMTEGANQIVLKVAKGPKQALSPLTAQQLAAFTEYMNKIKVAGTTFSIVSRSPQYVKAKLTVYYDPTVLNQQGQRLDGTQDKPVDDAINLYVQNLPFNGLFDVQKCIDEVQKVPGVVTLDFNTRQAFAVSQVGVSPPQLQWIWPWIRPDAGYLFYAPNAAFAPSVTIDYAPFVESEWDADNP